MNGAGTAIAAARPKRVRRSMSAEEALLSQPVPDCKIDRNTFLGGSEFAIVLGVGRITPVRLWQFKTRRAEPDQVSPQLQRMFESGKRLEPIVLAMLLAKLRAQGLEVELVARNRRYFDPEHDWMSVEIDFELIVTGTITINGVDVYLDHELVNGDAKTVRGFARAKWGDEETEEVPVDYAAQFMGGLMVAPGKRRLCVVGAMMGLDDVYLYWVQRDDETIAGMREKLVSFWVDHVQTGRVPDVKKFSDIKDLFPLGNGKTLEATAEVAAQVEKLRAQRIENAKGKAADEQLSLEVGEYLCDYTQLTVNGRPVATFKTETRISVDLDAMRRQHPGLVALFEKETTTRVLRLKRQR